MRTLTVFNYDDFIKVARYYNPEKIVGVCFKTKKTGDYVTRIAVMASTSTQDTVIELEYVATYGADVLIDREMEKLKPKMQKLIQTLEKDGFVVIDGYWHDGSS